MPMYALCIIETDAVCKLMEHDTFISKKFFRNQDMTMTYHERQESVSSYTMHHAIEHNEDFALHMIEQAKSWI